MDTHQWLTMLLILLIGVLFFIVRKQSLKNNRILKNKDFTFKNLNRQEFLHHLYYELNVKGLANYLFQEKPRFETIGFKGITVDLIIYHVDDNRLWYMVENNYGISSLMAYTDGKTVELTWDD